MKCLFSAKVTERPIPDVRWIVALRWGRDDAYVNAFAAIYLDGITPRNVASAIATFERSLDTPKSRFDRYLRGDPAALSEQERQGYRLFKSYGCVSCHQGVNVGGNMLQTFGVVADYFAGRGTVPKADFGRFNVTGREEGSLRVQGAEPPARSLDAALLPRRDRMAESRDDGPFLRTRRQASTTRC
jgi:cytochrome c peroxidase